MIWTYDRLKDTGITDELTGEGLVRLQHMFADGTWENWVPASSPATPLVGFNRELEEQLTTQWDKTGLLEGIVGDRPRYLMAQLLENQTSYMKNTTKCSLAEEHQTLLKRLALPIVRRTFATLVHLPSFGVISLPTALDKTGQPIFAISRNMKLIFYPDNVLGRNTGDDVEFCQPTDIELEFCQSFGEHAKREISAMVLENTLQNVDTYWYVPFMGSDLVTDPQTEIRRIGFITRYAKSNRETA